MTSERVYPDSPVDDFPEPPVSFTDKEGRAIEVVGYEPDDEAPEALVEMYVAFDPADRAQGIPPSGEERIRSWLDPLFDAGYNVVAWHDDTVAGHATLVPDGDDYELAIFVLQAYQHAGIGTHLIEALLGHGAAHGVERVWLTVERWNTAAVTLYQNVGFELSNDRTFEHEFSLRLS